MHTSGQCQSWAWESGTACAKQVQGFSWASLSWTRTDLHHMPNCAYQSACGDSSFGEGKRDMEEQEETLEQGGSKEKPEHARGKGLPSWGGLRETQLALVQKAIWVGTDREETQEEVHLWEDCSLSTCIRRKEELKQRNHYKINPASCFAIVLSERLIVVCSEEAEDQQKGSRRKLRHVCLSVSLNFCFYF